MKPTLLSALLVTLMVGQSFAAADPGTPGGLPAGEKQAKDILNKSPRHGEWIDITVPGRQTPLKAYIVHPERSDKAPVVIVIQEIFGLTDWIRGVADQLAADGFIAIAPDLLSGKGPNGGGTEAFPSRDDVTRAVRDLKAPQVMIDLNAVRDYGLHLPSADGKSASIGFCWGGGMSFAFATAQPQLNAAVVYYGVPPSREAMAKINAPVAGFYGGNDNRITSTVQPTTAQMQQLGKTYSPHVYDGAGHGFLRAQDPGAGGPNFEAAQQAWPATIEFLREHTK